VSAPALSCVWQKPRQTSHSYLAVSPGGWVAHRFGGKRGISYNGRSHRPDAARQAAFCISVARRGALITAEDYVKVRVKLFASARQAVGHSSLEVDLPGGATVAGLQALLRDEPYQADLERLRLLVLVNSRYAKPDRVLQEGDEVAFIPPISGG
jgi:molybdopterin converting factor subunit 1